MAKERKASVIYEGNASQLVYAFPFDYLRKKFVKVEDIYTNITELTMGVDYTVEDKQVRLVKGIPLGHSVKIYRETTTAPLVEWQDASVLRSADLSLQEVQLLHLAEETADKVFDSGMSTAYDNPNCWDGQYKRIINALDPIEDGDVVTLRYIKANQDSLLNQLKNTGATQNSSIVATGDTQNARLVSTGDNQNTRLTTTGDTQNTRLVTTGNSYVSTMTTLRDATTTKATEANNSADLAQKWAEAEDSPNGEYGSKSSIGWAREAKASASNAAASASASQSSADSSASYATTASSSANAAKQSALSSANSASAASSSASNAATSASNAKLSETNAANSAKAAAQSAIDAAKFDPSSYYSKKEVDAKIPTKASQLENDSGYLSPTSIEIQELKAAMASIPTKTSQLINDSGFAVISNGHLVINGSELWIE
nr:MAG TPA: tail fiber protein [Caudoviricetes sp.]